MGLHIGWVTIDATDVKKLADFWEQALPSKRIYDDGAEEIILKTKEGGYKILFLKAPDQKKTKNRLHLDLVPDDRDAEVARLESLGATRADIGQTGEETWVVMADPEGNEFCVLRPGTDSDT